MSRSTITGPPTTTGPPSPVATERTTVHTVHLSPLGPLTLMARHGCLTHVVMEDQAHAAAPPPASQRDDRAFAEMVQQLDEYFVGTRTDFDVPDLEEPLRVVPRRGMVLLFQHRLRHQGAPVLRGTKHVLRTDVMYRRDAA